MINSELNPSINITYANFCQLSHDWHHDNNILIRTTNNFKKSINPKTQKTFIMGHNKSGSYATHIGNTEIK
jgi:hypothetical protein